MKIDDIRKDLDFLSDRDVIIFGSFATKENTSLSDIDIAIITKTLDEGENLRVRIEASGKAPKKYDIQVFESLPMVLKGSILENFLILFGDPLEIGMYLYHFRKLWEDYSYRVEVPTIEEIRKSLAEGF